MKAIPTIADGIQFRSRLEAVWYLVFKRLGWHPEYESEPLTLEWDFPQADGSKSSLNYLPDFWIPDIDRYVELKPLRKTYPKRDQLSICAAYVLGYETPTLIILGSPFQYYAVECNERHKGNPHGFRVEIDIPYGSIGYWGVSDCYPDETPDLDWFQDPRKNDCSPCPDGLTEPNARLRREVVECWNETQWRSPK